MTDNRTNDKPTGFDAAFALKILGALGVLGTFLVTLGGVTGTLPRLFRNSAGIVATQITLAFAGLLLATAAVLVLGRLTTKPDRYTKLKVAIAGLALIGGIAFGVGAVWVVALAVQSPQGTERPTLSATVVPNKNDTATIELTTEASGLGSREWVRVGGLLYDDTGATSTSHFFYRSDVGPDANGKVHSTVKIAVPTKGWERAAFAARIYDTDAELNDPFDLADCTLPDSGPGQTPRRPTESEERQVLTQGCLEVLINPGRLRLYARRAIK